MKAKGLLGLPPCASACSLVNIEGRLMTREQRAELSPTSEQHTGRLPSLTEAALLV